jgi:hypothetical protein
MLIDASIRGLTCISGRTRAGRQPGSLPCTQHSTAASLAARQRNATCTVQHPGARGLFPGFKGDDKPFACMHDLPQSQSVSHSSSSELARPAWRPMPLMKRHELRSVGSHA